MMSYLPPMTMSTLVSSLRMLQPKLAISKPWRMLSLTTASLFESFIDKEFARAQRELDTETLDNPGSLLHKLERDQKWRIKAAKRARTARLFQSPREPRRLTWDTIEQLRYLKQESDEEWTTEKLAESFGISKGLVIKVLKSKFVPTNNTRKIQDKAASINAGLLPEMASSPPADEKSLVSSFSENRLVAPMKPGLKTATKETDLITAAKKKSLGTVTVKLDLKRAANKSVQRREPSQSNYISNRKSEPAFPKAKSPEGNRNATFNNSEKPAIHHTNSNFEESESLSYSNQTFPSPGKNLRQGYSRGGHLNESHVREDRELSGTEYKEEPGTQYEEELNIDMENLESYDDGSPPPKIIQRGNEFFDENGEFLYRL